MPNVEIEKYSMVACQSIMNRQIDILGKSEGNTNDTFIQNEGIHFDFYHFDDPAWNRKLPILKKENFMLTIFETGFIIFLSEKTCRKNLQDIKESS
jgi:hypothetical protein